MWGGFSLRGSLVANIAVALTIGVVVAATQLWTYQSEILSTDEQTFMLMAQDILRGHLPYIGIYDNKPPVLFFSLAGAMALFGQSLETTRLFGDLCIFVTACMIFAVCRPRSGRWAALFTAIAFVAAHTAGFGGYTSAELLCNVFCAAALLLMINWGSRRWSSWLVGGLLALAALTRSNLIILVVAVGLLYAIAMVRPEWLAVRRTGIIGYIIGGLTVPAALVALYASQNGLADLWLATVTVPLSYATSQYPLTRVAQWILSAGFAEDKGKAELAFALVLAVSLVLPFLAPRATAEAWPGLFIAAGVLAATMISMLLGGIFFSHYILQAFPPAAVFIGLAASGDRWKHGAIGLGTLTAGALGLVYATPLSLAYLPHLRDMAGDRPMLQMAISISADQAPEDLVWPRSYAQLVLFYLNQPPPSRAATFPNTINWPVIIDTLVANGYVPPDEFGRLMRLKPRYIITVKDKPTDGLKGKDAEAFASLLAVDYEKWFDVGNAPFMVYRRWDSVPSG